MTKKKEQQREVYYAVLEEVVDDLGGQFFILSEDRRGHDRLVSLTCLNDEERLAYWEYRIEEIQARFRTCSLKLGEWIFALIHRSPLDKDVDWHDMFDIVTRNFVMEEFDQEIQFLVSCGGLGASRFYHVLQESEGDVDLMKEYISLAVDASNYLSLTSWLKIQRDDIASAPALTNTAIAMLSIYQGKVITPKNCNQIAKEHGRSSSGITIYQAYSHLNAKTRMREADSEKYSVRKKINGIRSIISLLTPEQKTRAEEDLAALEKILTKR